MLSNGLINTNGFSLMTMLMTSEKPLLVIVHEEETPEILKRYNEKLGLAKKLGYRCEDNSGLVKDDPSLILI